MARLFGTDGVRGLANRDVTPELAMSLAQATAHVLGAGRAIAACRRASLLRDGAAQGERELRGEDDARRAADAVRAEEPADGRRPAR